MLILWSRKLLFVSGARPSEGRASNLSSWELTVRISDRYSQIEILELRDSYRTHSCSQAHLELHHSWGPCNLIRLVNSISFTVNA